MFQRTILGFLVAIASLVVVSPESVAFELNPAKPEETSSSSAVPSVEAAVAASPVEQRHMDLVDDGTPVAEIVVAPERPRMVTLAALELQTYIRMMSGAKLAIVTQPTEGATSRIYLGASEWTAKLGVSADGLKDGAYRIASGPDWIALVGNDVDFHPPFEPWPKSRGEVKEAGGAWIAMAKEKTGSGWGYPFATGYKGFWSPPDFTQQMRSRYGEDFAMLWKTKEGERPGFWDEDEGGTLNGVQDLLRELGVRFYMPGETGEVVPESRTVSLAVENKTVTPDFPLRHWNWYNYHAMPFDAVIWAKRLGMNSGYHQLGIMRGPHGMRAMTEGSELRKTHPEYFALRGGKRDTDHYGIGTPCLTSEGMFQETVKWLRFLFDEYDFPLVDIWPVDGFSVCQCETCKGKSANDLVWAFVDRVGRELYKSHPDKMILCGAYANYREPPTAVEKFTPNVGIFISNRGRALFDHPPVWDEYEADLRIWKDKLTSGKIIRNENNRMSINSAKQNAGRGNGALVSFPVIHPRAMAKDLQFVKGLSMGEFGEISLEKNDYRNPAIDHLPLYVQARFLWDTDTDLDALLDDYFAKFYGPAAPQMKEAMTFAEENYSRTDRSRQGGRADPSNVPLATTLKFRELLDKAREAAGETIYGQRIAAIQAELIPGEKLIARQNAEDERMAAARTNAIRLTGVDAAALDSATAYALKPVSGADGQPPTTVKFGWDANALVVEMRCEEPDPANLLVSDQVWDGDHVAIALETPDHSYYKIEVNPDGALAEGDPGNKWQSLANVKTERGENFWQVRLKIPVVNQEEGQSDPLHRVVGSKPSESSPWFVNVARMRVRNGETSIQALAPPVPKAESPIYDVRSFGRLVIE